MHAHTSTAATRVARSIRGLRPVGAPPATGALRSVRVLIGIALSAAAAGALLAAGAAQAAEFRNGRLWLEIHALGEVYELTTPSGITGTVGAQRVGGTLTSLTLPSEAFAVVGDTIAVEPDLAPITGLIGSFANDSGQFTRQGGALQGAMGLHFPGFPALSALLTVCVQIPCDDDALLFQVDLDLNVVGVGGSDFFDMAGLLVTLTGDTWTTGRAEVLTGGGSVSRSGTIRQLAGDRTRVRLVSPLSIELEQGDSPTPPPLSQIPAFAVLQLDVPEPGASAAGAAALFALAGLARRRRAPGSPPALGRAAGRANRDARIATPIDLRRPDVLAAGTGRGAGKAPRGVAPRVIWCRMSLDVGLRDTCVRTGR